MFDIDGYDKPFYGVVTGYFKGSPLLTAEQPISPRAVFKNIRKVPDSK